LRNTSFRPGRSAHQAAETTISAKSAHSLARQGRRNGAAGDGRAALECVTLPHLDRAAFNRHYAADVKVEGD
jgi:hypothetical protein